MIRTVTLIVRASSIWRGRRTLSSTTLYASDRALAYLSAPGGTGLRCGMPVEPGPEQPGVVRPKHRAMDTMTSLRPVRGTHDIVGETALRHRRVIETGRDVAARYGYHEVATPVFEFTEVFARTLGETSDIVTKEMYTFEDRGGDGLTLRPEYTAGIARAFISGSLGQQLPIKLFASGPMFRYERPQKGRLRQFHQIDVEVLGAAEPLADVEVIALGARILPSWASPATSFWSSTAWAIRRAAGRIGKISSAICRGIATICPKKARTDSSAIRSGSWTARTQRDREILTGAPSLANSLNEESHGFFAEVRAGLDALGIAYRINPALVRGLDYYTHTAFEFTTTALGAQGAVLAGGRYDGLVATMGGPDTPGIGGPPGSSASPCCLPRRRPSPRPIAVVPIGDGATLRGAAARRGAARRRPPRRARL